MHHVLVLTHTPTIDSHQTTVIKASLLQWPTALPLIQRCKHNNKATQLLANTRVIRQHR
jgi:hypothetical protein